MSTPPRLRLRWIALLILAGIAARAAACFAFPQNLSDDRDAYLAIAQGLADGRGFSSPGSTVPTAFRPPLYPILLAPVSGADQVAARVVLHCALGGVTVAAVLWLATLSGLSPRRRFVAGLFAAFDPLLVYYATLPMTETLAATGSALLLATGAAACKSSSATRRSVYSALGAMAFGICVMTRPTYWAFTVCVVGFGIWQYLRGTVDSEKHPPRKRDWLLGGVLTVVCVAPWCIRNALVMGRPILTTTHGGYTLLLGNNEAYYREVVEQPLGTVWDGSQGGGQAEWIKTVDEQLSGEGVQGEIATDRWMKNRAWEAIGRNPVTFLKACARRFLAFWSVRPHSDSASAVGTAAGAVVAVYYSALWLLLLAGTWNALRRGGCAVELSMLLVAAFMLVHLVYWTDARMRAPIVPAIAILAARAGRRP